MNFDADDKVVAYCIENQEEGSNYGKHNYVFEERFGHNCEFCFLPKDKANYKPLVKRFKDTHNRIWLQHNCQSSPCPHGKIVFVEVVEN